MYFARLLIIIAVFTSCSGGQKLESRNGFAVVPEPKADEAVATFGGGCFWAMQECMLQLKGVNKVISGYAGGNTVDPDYDQVLTGNTGHAEAVQVYYDPTIIKFRTLIEAFYVAHDGTQVNRQGPDIGTDYRSVAFYRDSSEEETIRSIIYKLDSLNGYNQPIVTELLPFTVFYPAEMSHQDYYKKHPWDPYIRKVSKPKVLKLREQMPDRIKPDYLE